jgi:hypothetical protein
VPIRFQHSPGLTSTLQSVSALHIHLQGDRVLSSAARCRWCPQHMPHISQGAMPTRSLSWRSFHSTVSTLTLLKRFSELNVIYYRYLCYCVYCHLLVLAHLSIRHRRSISASCLWISWLDAVKIIASHASYEVSGAWRHELKITTPLTIGAEFLPSLAYSPPPATCYPHHVADVPRPSV